MANFVFPNIIDTALDDVSAVTAQLNEAQEFPDTVNIDANLVHDTSKTPKIVDEVEEKTDNIGLALPNPITDQINLPDSIEDGDFGTRIPASNTYYSDSNEDEESNSTVLINPSKDPEYDYSEVDDQSNKPHLSELSLGLNNPHYLQKPLFIQNNNLSFKPVTVSIDSSATGSASQSYSVSSEKTKLNKTVLTIPQVNISSITDYPVENVQIQISAPVRVDGFMPFSGSASGETSASGSASAGDELKLILDKEKNIKKGKYLGEDDNGSGDKRHEDSSSEDLADDLVTEEELDQDLPLNKSTKKRIKKIEMLPKLLSKEEEEMKEILEREVKNKNRNNTKTNVQVLFPSLTDKSNKRNNSDNFAASKLKGAMKAKKQAKKNRFKRDIESDSSTIITKIPFTEPNNIALFSNPFWNVKSDRGASARSFLPLIPQHQMMTNMIRKRWKIPGNLFFVDIFF